MNDNRRQRAAASSPTSVRRAAYDEEDFLEVSRLTSSKVRTLWVCEYSQLLQGAPCAQSSAGGWFFPMDLLKTDSVVVLRGVEEECEKLTEQAFWVCGRQTVEFV